jgi:hypothetical protein
MTELVLVLHGIALFFLLPDYAIAARANSRSQVGWAISGFLIYFAFVALAMFPIFQFARGTDGIASYVIPVSTCAIGIVGSLVVCRFVLPTPGRRLPGKRTAVLSTGLIIAAIVQDQWPSFLRGYVIEHGGPWDRGHMGELQQMRALADVKGLLIIVAISVFFILLLVLIRNWQIGKSLADS